EKATKLGGKPQNAIDSKVPLLDPEQKAYLAGGVDGEGCVYASGNQIGITIAHTNLRWLLDIQRMTRGGRIYEHKPRGANWRPCWSLNFEKFESIDILKQILAYLYIKKTKALEALTIVDLEPYKWIL
ncbi:LAGLIDADG family homing endonuclease, partial [Candidatus Hakubella thermalkaliphila]